MLHHLRLAPGAVALAFVLGPAIPVVVASALAHEPASARPSSGPAEAAIADEAAPTAASDTAGEPFGLPLEGEAAEAFLRTAKVIDRKDIGTGVTRPQRLTLTDGTRTLRAVWKTIDERKMGLARMEAGGYEFDFRDSWKNEVAAYELSKMLGLDFVPPTVEREVDGRHGSLQLWVAQALTEKERQKRGLKPDHAARWMQQIYCVRLFHQLTYNTDFQNVENVLVDPAFRVYLIDSSRAFRIQKELLAPDDLQCFSRRVLEELAALDGAGLEQHLGRWLDGLQIDGLLARRDLIEALVKVRLAANGPGQVLFY